MPLNDFQVSSLKTAKCLLTTTGDAGGADILVDKDRHFRNSFGKEL